jgi:hypothetical protein
MSKGVGHIKKKIRDIGFLPPLLVLFLGKSLWLLCFCKKKQSKSGL